MKNENALAFVIAYYLSKFDDLAYETLGFGTRHKHTKKQNGSRESIPTLSRT